MPLRIIDADLVKQLLPIAACIDVLAEAMTALSAGQVSMPPRLVTPLIDDSGALLSMPGSPRDGGYYGSKLISLHPGNAGGQCPVIQGFVALFDHATGEPVA